MKAFLTVLAFALFCSGARARTGSAGEITKQQYEERMMELSLQIEEADLLSSRYDYISQLFKAMAGDFSRAARAASRWKTIKTDFYKKGAASYSKYSEHFKNKAEDQKAKTRAFKADKSAFRDFHGHKFK